MKIVITANDRQREELAAGNNGIDWIRVDDPSAFADHPDADAFFNLQENAGEVVYQIDDRPIFINSVITTLQETGAADNIIRINGWTGFLSRSVWDVAGKISEPCREVMTALNKKIAPAPDQPGLIAARIIAMIINEAYFAVGDGVSSRAETDTAMKLGTNYPYGPFEWCIAIGADKVATLLRKLSGTDHRYTPAALLTEETKL